MKITKSTIHTAKLSNNCPTCYATDGLELSFDQSIKENVFYSKASTQTVDQLYCQTCNNVIYPVDWNEDIERVYEYNKKLATPKKTGYTLKTLSYWVIAIDLLVIAGIAYYLTVY